MSIVKKYKFSQNSELILCGAVMHDIIEDTPVTFVDIENKFNRPTANLIQEVTNDPYEVQRQGKIPYMKRPKKRDATCQFKF